MVVRVVSYRWRASVCEVGQTQSRHCICTSEEGVINDAEYSILEEYWCY